MKRVRRILIRVTLMIVIPVIVIWLVVEAYLAGGRYVTAENAYVKADIVNIGSEIDGRVVQVFVNDYDQVESGQPLFEIDPEPYGIAIAAAEAQMAAVAQQVEALRALYRQGEAEIRAAEEDIRYLTAEHDRQQELVAQGAGTQSKLDAAEHALFAARRDLAILKEQNAVVRADLGGAIDAPVEDQPMYQAAQAMREEAALKLTRTLVTAPMSGTLSQVLLEVGEYIEAGAPVFALVATGDPWIEVNLKEVDLTHVTVGQVATVVVDAYPDVTWTAVVHSISPATGAEFALLPPQNSTGNWVKVVQRVPVRLKLDNSHDTELLRSGMTVAVSIDTEQERTFDSVVDGVLADVLPSQ